MAPPAGTAAEVAHAAGEVAKIGHKSPRYAITVCGVVASLGLVLAFVYLLMTRPPESPKTPIPTTGDWLTRSQFLEALAVRDQKLSPATNEALSEIRRALDALRSESAAAEKVREDRSRSVIETLSRIERRLDAQGTRVDRLYERIMGTASMQPAGPK